MNVAIGDKLTVTLAIRQSRKNGPGIPAGSQVEVLHTMPSRFGPGLALKVRDLVTGVERFANEDHFGPLGATPGTGAVQTCGTCGQPGHKSPTCPMNVGGSQAAGQGADPSVAAGPIPADPGTGQVGPFSTLEQMAAVVLAGEPKRKRGPKPITGLWARIAAVAEVENRVLLYGMPGTGKTTAGHANPPAAGVVNITLTEETPMAELRGHFVPKGGDFVWMDGPVTVAAKTGARLLLDEIDHASTDAQTFLLAVLNEHGMNSFTLPTGELVEPVESFSAFATMNGVPEDLSPALRSRFGAKIEVDEVHPDAIASIPAELRTAALNSISSDPERAVTFREWKAFAKLSTKLDRDTAAFAVFGARAADILNTIAIGNGGI